MKEVRIKNKEESTYAGTDLPARNATALQAGNPFLMVY